MKKKLVLFPTIIVLMIGQSSVGFAVTNETPNVGTGKATQTLEVTQVNPENGEQRVNNQQEATKEQEIIDANLQKSNASSHQEQTKENEGKDEETPTLRSLKADKKEVVMGEIVKISADVQDKSGVKYVSVFYHNTDLDDGLESKNTKEVKLTYNTKTKAYEGGFFVSKDITDGTWDVTTVSLGDKVGNETTYSGESIQNKDASFVVKKNSEADKPEFEGPVFEGITASEQELSLNETATIKLKASDKSGIAFVNVTYIHKKTGIQREIYFEESKKSGDFEGVFAVNKYTANGDWEIAIIELIDVYSNTTYVTKKTGQPNPFESANITVKNASDGVTGSVVEDIYVWESHRNRKPGQTASVYVKVKEDREIMGVEAIFINKNSHKERILSLKHMMIFFG